MGTKLIKLVAACYLLVLLSSCGGGSGGSTEVATPDTSPVVNAINEQSTLVNIQKTVSLFATDTTYNQALTFTATSSSISPEH